MEKVLIIGANGNTGRILSEIISKSDHYEPVAMLRKESQKDLFEKKEIKTCLGDLEQDFKSCLDGVDKVIFAAGSGGHTGDDKTEAVDKKGAIKAIDYAKAHKIKKFVILSSMGTDTPEKVPGLETYLKAKKAADEHLKSSGLTYSILRPGALNNEKGTSKIKLTDQPSQSDSIPREDVAHALAYCLDDKNAKNKIFNFVSGSQDLLKTIENL
ncbi:MAG: SDR family oxidoreductase [Flavobacteriaceae bacterium]|nr:SDR family oxidoreductase [Psychroflexus sp.]